MKAFERQYERSDATSVFIDVERAVTLTAPPEQTIPVVVASPHSGNRYPRDLLQASKLDPSSLRKSEDAHVNTLFSGANSVGAPLLAAEFPRAYVDVNREPYELDPSMFDAPLPPYAITRSPRVAAGLGSIPRIVSAGIEIYARRLSFAEASARLNACYKPYHNALRRLVRSTHAKFENCVLIDAHSMPTAGLSIRDDLGGPIDIVIGDNHGKACHSQYSEAAISYFRDLGYAVILNDPYSGGFVTQSYSDPERNIHALQVEINRSLYMDEMTYETNSYFPKLTDHITGFISEIASI
jgi:N-formylglutamate amidohydrolase